MRTGAISIVTAAAVAATAFVLLTDVRPPSVPESTAFLVLTASSYMMSPSLPPVMALLFAAWVIKSYPHRAASERFTIEAQHAPVLDSGPVGHDDPIYPDGSRLAKTPPAGPRGIERALATPERLYDAQSSAVPPRDR